MLNKTSIKRLKQKEKVYRLLDGDGLYLEVRTNGEKYWRYRYLKISGKSTMVSLGRYPNVSIEIARIERDQKKKHIEYGSVSFADVSKRWH
ncbi:MAG: DUF4102 domain-containing protein [Gammaproteobacteria bacterium]|nr:DUF4102 domain-containing protein [Gammaproteobacteria bacterium]